MGGRKMNSQNTPLPQLSPREFGASLEAARLRASLQQELAKRTRNNISNDDTDWVKRATASTHIWTSCHTKTYNEHWQKEGRPHPEEPFPDNDYFALVFAIMESSEPVIWWEKSRDMMLSWASVAYFELQAMKTPYCGILFQTQKDKKVIQLVDYAKHLWRLSDERIKRAFPLAKDLDRQPERELHFENGSYIIGIPGGADQIRSYHPWGYLNDESSFQPDAGECYNEAIAAVAGKIIFNSSAGPGWYADARKDIFRNQES